MVPYHQGIVESFLFSYRESLEYLTCWKLSLLAVLCVLKILFFSSQRIINTSVWTFQFHPGNNVGLGKDHTIFSLIDGLVKFEKFGPDRKKVLIPDNLRMTLILIMAGRTEVLIFWCWQVSVYPQEVQPENPNSYRARKREYFRLQRERRKARKEGKALRPQLVLASVDDGAVIAAETSNCWL